MRRRRTTTRNAAGDFFVKKAVFPHHAKITDFETFVWLAATELTQERVLYAQIDDEKYLIAYGVDRSKHKTPECLTVYDDINAIVITKVNGFKKFIRFDPFDGDMLKYENDFDNHATYKDTVVFLRVEILQTETDEMVLEELNNTVKFEEVKFPA